MTAIPRLTVKDEDGFQCSPYGRLFKQTSGDKKKVGEMNLVSFSFILENNNKNKCFRLSQETFLNKIH